MRILGIDYGSKRVGVAISDDTTTLAFPKAVLRNSHTLMGELRATVEANGVSEIVVGKSLNLDLSDNLLMEDIRRFAERLHKETKTPVHFEPEYFTSVEARKGETPPALVDASAAALILQRFLDKRNNSR
ncbi:hypothetical protein A3D62_00145 [Candidatus Kaiserbacteria bacterium RIFCSPHIGHO2_02_FULL_49_11]|uniref:Putative pre-16S rRNA nuclease n=1 Tax=Candidatus Kaiserbacteria bacterium RIFCSPHIGHO2_02_FULL_49_11 TaxID=1798489 RepID=A0A1F6D1D2_9BACT|nr:MAG: hypothetical protein A3D62_00145 [Candidatus Kaiserbacteria bacterium RIFCSPHIGHO2_02_FULL_49_11]